MGGCCVRHDCEVEETLDFIGDELVHLGPGTYCWVSVKRFRLGGEASDADVLAALLRHPQYNDHYAGQRVAEQSSHDVHGPYRLDRIAVGSFVQISSEAATALIFDWAAECEQCPIPRDVRERLGARVVPDIASGVLWQLPDLRATAEHDWGWVVGQRGFHEFVSIDRATRTVALVVASDD
jgi:hypothetical protein